MIGVTGIAPATSRFPTERAPTALHPVLVSLASLRLRAALGLEEVSVAESRWDQLCLDESLLDRLAALLAVVLLAHHVVGELVLLRLVLGSPRVHAPERIRTSVPSFGRSDPGLLEDGSLEAQPRDRTEPAPLQGARGH